MSELIEKIAQFVIRRELAPVAIFLLESGKPLSRAGSQVLIFFLPMARGWSDYEQLIELLDDRDQVERLICRIEELEDQRVNGSRGAVGSPRSLA